MRLNASLLQLGGTVLAYCAIALGTPTASGQNPVFFPSVDIDQTKLLTGCITATDTSCTYTLKDVLNSGGHFWTTPFQPYDPVHKTGDGFGEGDNGPRAAQRHFFNPLPQSPPYRFLRLNGLDSQSCFECHNSTGSESVDSRGALIRKPYGVAGAAGSNSNAFINPLYPRPETLFIRNPPAVFGSGYQQSVGDEMTLELLVERYGARLRAKRAPGVPYHQALTAKGIPFGEFITTYAPNTAAKVAANVDTCAAGIADPVSIGGQANYADDLTKLQGVSCDLVIRPFQWKGVASSLRHFVRDALDFHFSMQAFEKVGFCDCDRDGKGSQSTGTEVTMGEVSAIVAFVGMTRPPVQDQLTTASQQRGKAIFVGQASGSYQKMCANCHVESLTLVAPSMLIEWPINSELKYLNPSDETTWPIREKDCKGGVPPDGANACPVESTYSASTNSSTLSSRNRGALVSPVSSSKELSIVHRFETNLIGIRSQRGFDEVRFASPARRPQAIRGLRAPIRTGNSVIGNDYVVPLNPPASDLTPLQLYRLPTNGDGTVTVPLLSDLKRHRMAASLSDPVGTISGSNPPVQYPTQGTDVAGVNTVADEYMTRPLWGVADTGPWMHDGRAMTLLEAIMMHGDSSTGSEAGPVIDVFKNLSESDQQAVVDFLLTLRLPLPPGS